MYLAATFVAFGTLAVDWGHDGVLPAMVARDHSLAGLLLGNSIAWRLSAAVVVYAVMALICVALGYSAELQWALLLTFILAVLNSLIAACKDTIRGFERGRHSSLCSRRAAIALGYPGSACVAAWRAHAHRVDGRERDGCHRTGLYPQHPSLRGRR
ncbi:MAG: hypothetical protein WDO74_30880 [Pseudomonadota bacterium]